MCTIIYLEETLENYLCYIWVVPLFLICFLSSFQKSFITKMYYFNYFKITFFFMFIYIVLYMTCIVYLLSALSLIHKVVLFSCPTISHTTFTYLLGAMEKTSNTETVSLVLLFHSLLLQNILFPHIHTHQKNLV